MKAKEYVEEYANTILLFYQNRQLDEIDKIIKTIFISLSEEVEDICEMRHSRSNDTLFGAIKQENDKWNAIRKSFEKKIGLPVLKRDGFVRFWFKEIPLVQHLYEKRYGKIYSEEE